MRLRFTVAGLALLTVCAVSCKVSDDPATSTKPTIHTEHVDSIAATELSDLFDLPIRGKLGEWYSGDYSYYRMADSAMLLHGPFAFSYADSGSFEDMFWKETVGYEGAFVDGQKSGTFVERLYHNDGIDLYSEWMVTLTFDADTCLKATFKGAIGHIMPITEYTFDSVPNCQFQDVVDRAWGLWEDSWLEQQGAEK